MTLQKQYVDIKLLDYPGIYEIDQEDLSSEEDTFFLVLSRNNLMLN